MLLPAQKADPLLEHEAQLGLINVILCLILNNLNCILDVLTFLGCFINSNLSCLLKTLSFCVVNLLMICDKLVLFVVLHLRIVYFSMGFFNFGLGDPVLPSRLQNVKVILSHVLLCTQNYRISLALEFSDLTPLSNSPFRLNVVVTSKYIGKDSLTLNSKFSFKARIMICLYL